MSAPGRLKRESRIAWRAGSLGNKVIDHERVTGLQDTSLEVAAAYEVMAAGISKVWFSS